MTYLIRAETLKKRYLQYMDWQNRRNKGLANRKQSNGKVYIIRKQGGGAK
jgi:hypothetical protein